MTQTTADKLAEALEEYNKIKENQKADLDKHYCPIALRDFIEEHGETIRQALQQPEPEVVTFSEFIQSICAYTVNDKVIKETVAELKVKHPKGIIIKDSKE